VNVVVFLISILLSFVVSIAYASTDTLVEHIASEKILPALNTNASAPHFWQAIFIVTAIAMSIIGVFLFWNYRLRQEIDAKHRAEAAWRGSDQRFQDAMEAVSESIWEWDLVTGERYFTAGLFLGLDYRLADIPSNDADWQALIHPDDQCLRLQKITQHEQNPEQRNSLLTLEYRLQRANRSYAHILASGRVTERDETGHPTKRTGTLRDVTVYKEAEAKIQRLTQAVEQSPALVIITNPRGDIEYVNDKLFAMTHYSKPEVIGKRARMLLSNQANPRELVALRQAMRAGNEWHGELLHQGKTGQTFWATVSVSPIFDGHDKLTHFVSINEDISDRKAAEEALRSREIQLETILNEIPLAIVVVDENGTILIANPHADKEVESDSSIIGRNMLSFYANPHQRAEVISQLQTKGRIDGMQVSYKTDQGGVLEGLISVIPIRYGEETARLGVMINLTERLRIERELAEAKDAAEKANHIKSHFLASMSHEIRTPMNAIIGLTHIALQTELNTQQRDYLAKIQSSAHALLGIINDILDVSKIEAGKLAIEQIPFNLEAILDSLSSLVAAKAQEKGLEVLFSMTQDVPQQLIGDPLRLNQVLINLTQNAIKFTNEGEILIQVIHLHTEEQRSTLRFSISDTGIGIDKTALPFLFEAFSQADQSYARRFSGTGLGLTICQFVVNLMGGDIYVDSTPGHGSTFWFDLVFDLTEDQIVPKGAITGLHDRRVLIVDDNAIARQVLTDRLESLSMRVRAVTSGIEALQLLEDCADNKTLDYDLIFMDWKMPGMDGIETVKRMRAVPGLLKIPVIIMVTAHGREAALKQAEGVEIKGFLLKPISQSLLFNCVVEALHGEKSSTFITPVVPPDKRSAQQLTGHILLVEDNRINQQVAQEILQGMGLSVIIAENGEQALQIMTTNTFDLVVMDLQMPGMDGFETARHIRENPQWTKIPIVAMTAHTMSGDREKCLAVGMNEHIAKPVNPDRVYQVLVRWLAVDIHTIQDLSQQEFSQLPKRLPGIDIKWGVQRIGGNIELYESLLKNFLQDHRYALEKIRVSLEDERPEEARRLVHTLSGVSGNLGATLLEKASIFFEQHIKQKNHSHYDADFHQLEQSFSEVMNGLQIWLRSRTDNNAQPIPASHELLGDVLEKFESMLQEADSAALQLLPQVLSKLGMKKNSSESEQLTTLLQEYNFDSALEKYSDMLSSYRRQLLEQ